jgi:hypothetical protein
MLIRAAMKRRDEVLLDRSIRMVDIHGLLAGARDTIRTLRLVIFLLQVAVFQMHKTVFNMHMVISILHKTVFRLHETISALHEAVALALPYLHVPESMPPLCQALDHQLPAPICS